MKILDIRTKCYLCSEEAVELHNGIIPLCQRCDVRVREHKGMTPKDRYKTEQEVVEDYVRYYASLKAKREKGIKGGELGMKGTNETKQNEDTQ